MLKKFNVFALALLIIGQTILGPIGTSVAFAEEQDESDDVNDTFTQPAADTSDADSTTEETSVNKDELKTLLENQKAEEDYEEVSYSAYLQAVAVGQEVYDKVDATQEDVNTAVDKIENAVNGLKQKVSTEGEDDEPAQEEPANSEEIVPATVKIAADNPVKIDNVGITHYKIEGQTPSEWANDYGGMIDKDGTGQGYQFDIGFEVTVGVEHTSEAGAYFEFLLPDTIIDYNNKFNGPLSIEGVSHITGNFSTDGNIVKVNIQGLRIEDTGKITPSLNFWSGFTLSGNSINQNLEIPTSSGGTVTIPLTFKPNVNQSEDVTKVKDGDPTLDSTTGVHVMDWEVWINKTGNIFSSVNLSDQLSNNHELVESSINIEQYTVDINGNTEKDNDGYNTTGLANWQAVSIDSFVDHKAYKITYQTKVSLEPEEREGTPNFTNTFKFTNNGSSQTKGATQSVQYGPFIAKEAKTKGKYNSSWEIKYNHNTIGITNDNNELVDKMTGPHTIDVNSIKVYKASDASGNIIENPSEEAESGDYSIDTSKLESENEFTITFASGNANAYTIKYDAEYDASVFYDDDNGIAIKNSVTVPDKDPVIPSYTISENYLSKDYRVDFKKQEIIWTVTITNDHPTESMTGVTFTDKLTGEHTYVDESINDSTGFNKISENEIEITNITIPANNGSKTYTYRTKYNVDDATGLIIGDSFNNEAGIKWNHTNDDPDVDYTANAAATFEPDETSQTNARKVGEFDYDSQEFTWKVLVNVNQANIVDAVLDDTIGEGHVLHGNIEVYKAILNDSGNAGNDADIVKGNLVTTGFNIVPKNEGKGFTLTFNDLPDNNLTGDDAKAAYIIEYKTKDDDDIFGIGGNENEAGKRYTNEATFKTANSDAREIDDYLDVDIANEILTKSHNANTNTNVITWTLDINKSHSKLGESTLTDTPSGWQMLVKDSFEISKYNSQSNSATSTTFADAGAELEINDEEGNFTIEFDDLDAGYKVTYQTIGFPNQGGSNISNVATLVYAADGMDNQKGEQGEAEQYNFSGASGSFSLTKGNLKLQKVGVDSNTADTEFLEGVTFDLYKTVNGTDHLIREDLTTEANGELLIASLSYGDYVLVEKDGAPAKYDGNGKRFKVVLSEDNDVKDVELVDNNNKIVVLNNETPLEAGACTVFKITIEDIDDNPITSGNVTLTDSYGNETSHTVGNDGTVELPEKFTAGEYKVTHDVEGDLGKVIVKYDGTCGAEVQPDRTCPNFTVTITKDNNNTPLTGGDITFVDATDSTKVFTATEDTGGKYSVPNTTPAGKYKVYDGKQYLGEIDITYKGNCETTLTEAPTCEIFDLTIKDVDGNPNGNFEFEIKDKDGNSIEDSNGNTVFETDADGTFKLDKSLPAGEYDVYEKDATEPFDEFGSNPNCKAEVQPDRTKVCPTFTITIKDQTNNVGPNTEITLKKAGQEDVYSTTGDDGKIKVPSENLPAGEYNVYEGGIFLGKVAVEYTDNINCEAELDPTVSGAGFCKVFTLTINDRGNNPREGVTVIVKDSTNAVVKNSNGDEELITNEAGQVEYGDYVVKPGTYTAYELDDNGNEKRINSFTVDTTCESAVKPPTGGGGGWIPPAPSCDVFTVTVKQQGTIVGADVEITLKSGTTEVNGTTDANGKIVFDKADLSEGTYTAYDKDGQEVGTIVVSYDEEKCHDEIDLLVKSCETFTITVKESGEVVDAGTSLTLKDASGNTVGTGTTNADGKIVFNKDDLPKGKYTAVDKDGKEIANITVSYDEGKCQAVVDILLKACEHYKLTVVDTPNTFVEVKDKDGNTIVTGTTDANGNVTFTQSIPEGNYEVYIDGEKVGDLSVTDSCEGTITPEVEINPDKPEPEKPGDGEDDSNGDNGESNGGGDNTGNDNNDTNPPAGDGNGTDTGSKTPTGDGNNGNVNSTDTNGNKSDSGSKTDKLPQTGEEHYMYMIALGTLLLAAGASVLYRQRRKA